MANNRKTHHYNDWREHNNASTYNANYNVVNSGDNLHWRFKNPPQSEKSVFPPHFPQFHTSVSLKNNESPVPNFRPEGLSIQSPHPPWVSHNHGINASPDLSNNGQHFRPPPVYNSQIPSSNLLNPSYPNSSVPHSQVENKQASNINQQAAVNSSLTISQRLNFNQPPPSTTQLFRPSIQNYIPCNIPPPPVNYPRNVSPSFFESRSLINQPPPSLPSFPANPNLTSNLSTSQNIAITPAAPTTAFGYSFPTMPVTFPPTIEIQDVNQHTESLESSSEEKQLSNFLLHVKRSSTAKKSRIRDISVVEFRNRLSYALSILKELSACKENMMTLFNADKEEWDSESNKANQLKKQFLQTCDFLNNPEHLQCIKKKLFICKKKRKVKKKLKHKILDDKMNNLKRREEIHQNIDKWLDSIKEKNIKLKREVEMKKEADSILSEVRRKIHEAKHLLEKIKVFEKLRSARQVNAMNKGLILPEYDEKFQSNISKLKDLILKQLSDYENEEKALKVMLEAEQEGQLEEEALWKTKKMKKLQEKRRNNVLQSLFGDSEEPSKEDNIYLFYQFQTSGNKSIESLVQIRQQWDTMISENGERIPYTWIAPVPPSSSNWESVLES